ncbi:MAG: hypothetical protein J1E04_05415 [Alistipes sp.]|nr:hypothetical protein [Alistipes sp.]
MRVLIAAPTGREYRNIKAAVANAGATRHSYDTVNCGVGKAEAAATVATAVARASEPYDLIAVIGYAAGTAGFAQGDVVMPSWVRYHDCNVPDGFVPELTDPCELRGGDGTAVFTGDSFVDAAMVREVKSRFGVERALFDMEIGAVAIAARVCGGIPVAAVKFISDVPEAGHTDLSYEEFADANSDFMPLLRELEKL